MKKNLLLILIILISFGAKAQNWTDKLPQKTKSELTLNDYKNAFNEYWKNIKVINGRYIDEKGVERKAYGWKQFKRWEYFWEDRVDKKSGKFPKDMMHKTYVEYLKNNDKGVKAPWISMGPNTSDGGYAGIGRINSIAFHPTDVNTFWIGAPAGGLWVTADGGSSWTALTEQNEVLGVSGIAIPSDYATSEIIYIGTGDRDAYDNYGVGVLKSTDGGSTWNTTGLDFSTSSGEIVSKLLIDPSDDNILYAATTDGLYKTINAGANWTRESTVSFLDIEFHPTASSTLYGCTKYGKFYRSVNSGDSWILKWSSISGKRLEIALSPDTPDQIFIAAVNSTNGLEGIYRSENTGDDFTMVFDGTSDGGALLNWSTDGQGDNDGQGWYDLSLAVDPDNSNVVYLGGINTWRSFNSGVSWSQANHWYGGGGNPEVHADKHYLVFHPSTGDLFECNDGGIYRTPNGSTWYDLTNDLVISQMYGLGTAQTEDNVTIAGLQDNGTKLEYFGTWYDVLGGDGMKCLVDHSDASIQYGSYYYGDIRRTDDLWSSATNISDNIPGGADGAWVTPFVIDPNNSNILFIAYDTRIWKTYDKGETFQSSGFIGGVKTITISESTSDIVYAANSSSFYKSVIGGGTWLDKTGNLPVGSSTITDIAIKYDDYDKVWVTFSGYNSNGVYESSNGGDTWTNISSGLPNIPVNTIIHNKFEKAEDQLYVGTDYGVYIKKGNNDWVLYGTEFPKVVVTELAIYYDDETPVNSLLRASTYGRGLWEVPLDLSGNYVPDVTTVMKTNASETGIDIIGSINYTYNESITENGIVISEDPNPDLDDQGIIKLISDPIVSTGEFTINVAGLEDGKKYYVKAFGTSINGSGYGDELNFVFGVNAVKKINEDQDGIKIYPNPTKGKFVIDADLNEIYKITVLNIAGKEVFSDSFVKGSYDLSFLSKGLYFINIHFSENIITKKLVIE